MRKLTLTPQGAICNLGNYILRISCVLALLVMSLNILSAQCNASSGTIAGNVYQESSINGLFDSSENGIGGVLVLCYDDANALAGQATSNTNGSYQISGLNDGISYRLEFQSIGNTLDAYQISNSGSSIQFAASPSCDINYGILEASGDCGQNPEIVLTCFVQDDYGVNGQVATIIGLDHNFTNTSSVKKYADKSETGSVWGLDYSLTKNLIYSASFVKQYSALTPHGLGAIFQTTTGNNPTTSLFANLTTLGVDVGQLTVTDVNDCNYGAQVGKKGLGGLAVSDDGLNLYVVNIYNNTLVKVPTTGANPSNTIEYAIPDPGCSDGDARAFALNSYNGKYYVGVTCTAESSLNSSNTSMHVYEFDPNSTIFTLIFSSSYNKGHWYDAPANSFNTMHWLTDLDFTDDGNMLLSLSDRVGHRYCSNNGRLDHQFPDLLMAWNDNGVWTLEDNGTAGSLSGSGVGNTEGPGGGEFFGFDFWPSGPTYHPETALGSIYVLPGTNQVISTTYDPHFNSYSGGLHRYNTTDGTKVDFKELYTSDYQLNLGKATGFGDISSLCPPQELEIGNFVWNDLNSNGIQDAGELPLSGITLHLYTEGCNKIATTTTDLNGNYLFNQTNVDYDQDGTLDPLKFGEEYYIVLDDANYDIASMYYTIDGKEYLICASNTGMGTNAENNDSDAIKFQNICSAIDGQNGIHITQELNPGGNHGFDIGICRVDDLEFDLALYKEVVSSSIAKIGDEVTFRITVMNQGELAAAKVEVADHIPAGFDFVSSSNPNWTYSNGIAMTEILNLQVGETRQIVIKLQVNSESDDLINYAEVAGAYDPAGVALQDVDSVADMDPNNDNGGVVDSETDDLVDDNGSKDEDDHDPAMVYVFDLALRKTIVDPQDIYFAGDVIEFKITVFNQGNTEATDVEVVDYLPTGINFDATLNPDWADVNGVITYDVPANIAVGQSVSFPFYAEIPSGLPSGRLVNEAEVSQGYPLGFPGGLDYDSTSDNNADNDAGGEVGDLTDNLTTDHGIMDEDDHDPAAFFVDKFDLALIKETDVLAVSRGQLVTYTITVFNQGSVAANNIGIVDYIPEFMELVDSDWTLEADPSGDKAKMNLVLPNGLAPGESYELTIDLKVDDNAPAIRLVNGAEIFYTENMDGVDFSDQDVDSTPDDIKGNDLGGIPFAPDSDDVVNAPASMDEDDEDPAAVIVVVAEIVTSCTCLNNSTSSSAGQFQDEITVTGPSGQNWYIQNVIGMSDYCTISNAVPSNASGPSGFILEEVTQLSNNMSVYYMKGVHVDGQGYTIQLTNGEGNFQNLTNAGCSYSTPDISGSVSVCADAVVEYSTTAVAGTTFTWSLNGTAIGTGETVEVDFAGLAGTQILTLEPAGTSCLEAASLSVEIGNVNGVMACVGSVNISLGSDCTATVTPAMLMTSTPTPGAAYGIMLTDATGNAIVGNTLDASHLGQQIMAKVIDGCSGNSCWSTIIVEDKTAPEIFCQDIEITCNDMLFYTGPLASDNCDGDVEVVLVFEEIKALDCNENYIKEIKRQYRAEDSSGNQSPICDQTILVKRISLDHIDTDGDGDLESPVTFPPTFSMQGGNPLTCGSYATDDNGYPAPSVTGIPTLGGEDLYPIAHFYCNLSSGYVDETVSDNACVTKILRTWTVAEWWCAGGEMETYTQLIEVVDNQDPVITCPADFTVSTSGFACSANVNIPVPTATDVCSPSDIRLTMSYADGFVDNFNGSTVSLIAGVHQITYAAYDACGNSSTCQINVEVKDETNPIAICDQNTTVGLNETGQAIVYASVFDDGSFDECHLDKMEVLRMDAPACGSALVYSDNVVFCCQDVGNTVQVLFRVTDLAGNENTCMVNVEVQDKFAPTISCPTPMTIDCGTQYDITDMSSLNAQFGEATATDACQVSISSTAVANVNQCGVGTITRTFTASDANGSTQCTQVITISNPQPFVFADITWPLDYSTNANCIGDDFAPENLPSANGYPVVSEDQCDLIGITYQDQTFLVEPDNNSCFKILRRWSIIDWCQYDGASVGIWNYDQTLEISNNVAPTIDNGCDAISVCTYDPTCSNGFVDLVLTASDDCTPTDMLRWTYEIDLNTDGTVDVMNSGIGGMIDLSNDYPLGTHSLIWVVEDRCGNTVACTKSFTIINCKPPTAYCIDGVAISLQGMDLDGDGVIDAEMAELCVENVDNGSYHSCGYPVNLSFSADTTDNCIVFDCSDVGLNIVELWVTDINGHTSFCQATIDVQDTNDSNICDKFDLALINVLNTYDAANQMATFDLTICNQGNSAVTELEVTGYIPAGYSLNDPAWTLQANGDAVMSSVVGLGGLPAGGIAPGACHTKQITFSVNPGEELDEYKFYAEVTGGLNTNGQTAAQDCDSTPGSNTVVENTVMPGDPDDDNLDGGGPGAGEDEDDHDPAQIPLYDLALVKTTVTNPIYAVGDLIEFNINVENQGNTTASNIVVVDYIPCGFTFDAADNTSWTYDASTRIAETGLSGSLAPSGMTDVSIFLTLSDIESNCSGENYINFAEIASFTDPSGNTVPDVDSNPDNNNGNDGNVSNDVTDNSNGDEDDHDPEEICPSISLQNITTYCSNQTDVLSASPAGGIWQGQGITDAQTGAFDASLVTGGNTTITYVLTDGTCEVSSEITVIDPPAVTLTTPDPVCMNNDSNMPTTIDFSTLSSTSDGFWLDLDGAGISFASLVVDFADVPVGMYTFSFTTNTAVSPCVDVTETIEITVIDCNCPGFTASITSSNGASVCPGGSTDLTAVVTIANPAYSWSTGQTSSTITVSPSMSTDYFVTITDMDNAPCSEIRMITIDVNSLPICSADSNGPLCVGDALTLTESGGQANTWSWVGPNGFTSNVQNPSIASVTGANAGVYTVTIVDVNGCESVCATMLEVIEPPVLVLTTPPSVCSANDTGMATTLDFSSLSNISQGSWSDTDGTGVDLTNLSSVDFSAVAPGTYTFTFTTSNAVSPCANVSDTIEVTVIDCNCPGFTLAIASSETDEFCIGVTTVLSTTVSISNPSYSWSTGETTSSISVMPAVSTLYTVTVTDLDDLPCQEVQQIQITVNPLPICMASSNMPECPGDQINLFENGGSAVSWAWSGPNGFASPLQNPVITQTSLDNEGTYTVSILDANGCSSSCSVEFVFDDVTAPVLINCPDDMTISCDEVPDNLNTLGVASGIDNCDGNLPAVQLTTMNINSCSTGTIVRTFVVTDNSGNSSQCTQVITVNNVGEVLTLSDITLEPDTIFTESCNNLDPDFLGIEPVINGGNVACYNLSIDFEDSPMLDFPACQDTTTRTWTIVDSCQLNGDGMTGIFMLDQVIVVSDTTAPVITVVDSLFFDCVPADSLFVNLTAIVTDGCSATVTNNSAVGNGMEDASGFYFEGITEVIFTATDLCGNVAMDTTIIEVIPDTTAPEIKCQKPIFNITDDFTVEVNIYTSTIIEFIADDCTDSMDVVCFYVDSLEATTGNPADTVMVFDCMDVGSITPVFMLCMDEAGNTTTCKSDLQILDPNGFCNIISANVEGSITTDLNKGVENAEVRLVNAEMPMEYTSLDGLYAFENMPLGGNYQVVPYKNDDPLNGVTTLDLVLIQKHLLGQRYFEDAYDHIAADIDMSGSISSIDLIHLRKLILGVYTEFPDNTSWRMIDADFEFAENVDPLDLQLPESYNIDQLNNNMVVDFVGVKVGDVNGSVVAATTVPEAINRDLKSLKFFYQDRIVNKGDEVIVALNANADYAIEGFQMSIEHKGLSLEGVTSDMISVDASNIASIDAEVTNLSWNTMTGSPVELSDLLNLRFVATEDVVLSEVLKIADGAMSSEMYEAGSLDVISIELGNGADMTFDVSQNEPNPWSAETIINVDVAQSSKCEVSIHDMMGKLIVKIEKDLAAGSNQIIIDDKAMNRKGIFLYTVRVNNDQITKQMIRI